MILLCSLLFLMLFTLVSLLAIPFLKNKKFFSSAFLLLTLVTISFTTGLYFFSTNQTALKQWLTAGKEHYELQTEVQQLGGIDNIIAHIEQKVKNNPLDAKGWSILAKLYFAVGKEQAAKQALSRAQALEPKDEKIKKLNLK